MEELEKKSRLCLELNILEFIYNLIFKKWKNMKKITKEELAKMLNWNEYRNEITKEQEKLAKENNLVVIFWNSDDLLELRWAIDEEVWAWWWVEIYIDKNRKKIFYDSWYYYDEWELDGEFADIVQEYFNEKCIKIEANLEEFWEIKTSENNIARFYIFEDWEKFSDGLIIEI